jgi:hypothetical protein
VRRLAGPLDLGHGTPGEAGRRSGPPLGSAIRHLGTAAPHHLADDRGWSFDELEEWLTRQITTALLERRATRAAGRR